MVPINSSLLTITLYFFFFQALNFIVESFGLLNDLFPLPSILDAGYPVFDLHLADVLCDVILLPGLSSDLTFQVRIYNLLLIFLCTCFRLHPFTCPVPFLHREF